MIVEQTGIYIYIYSNTTRPISHYAARFWKAYIDRMSFGLAEGKLNITDLEYESRSVIS